MDITKGKTLRRKCEWITKWSQFADILGVIKTHIMSWYSFGFMLDKGVTYYLSYMR